MNDDNFQQLVDEYVNYLRICTRPYNDVLNDDELYGCALVGLWKASLNFNPCRSSFQTYLSHCVRYECLNEISAQKPQLHTLNTDPYHSDISNSLIDYLSHLSNVEKGMLIDYYIGGYSYREVGTKYNMSHTTARKKIKKALNRARNGV
jgi:RNA polymerase sigma factor (sigma-70 family)